MSHTLVSQVLPILCIVCISSLECNDPGVVSLPSDVHKLSSEHDQSEPHDV